MNRVGVGWWKAVRPSLRASFAAAVLVLAAACSSSAGASPEEVVRGAVDATADAGTARVTLSATFGGPTGPQSIGVDGVADLSDGRGRFDVDLTDLGLGPVEVVFDGSVIYLRLPAELIPIPTPWASIDVERLAAQGGETGLEALTDANPIQLLDLLVGASEVEEVGDDEVRGADTTRYRFVLDIERALESLPDEAREAFEALTESFALPDAPADVWIDDGGRVRRIASEVDSAGGAPGGSFNLEIYDYGTSLEVEVPPAEEVTDLSAFLAP